MDLAIGWGEGSWRALDGIVGLPGLDVDVVVEVEVVVVVIAVAGVEEMAAVALPGASWAKAECCSVAEEDRTLVLVEAGGCTIFRHLPFRRSRQVEHLLPSLTHEQFLHFPSPLHRQQTTIRLNQVSRILYR